MMGARNRNEGSEGKKRQTGENRGGAEVRAEGMASS